MERAYKYRIYPNKNQEELINKTFGCVRFVYNYYLNKRKELYENEKVSFTYNMCSKDLTKCVPHARDFSRVRLHSVKGDS